MFIMGCQGAKSVWLHIAKIVYFDLISGSETMYLKMMSGDIEKSYISLIFILKNVICYQFILIALILF